MKHMLTVAALAALLAAPLQAIPAFARKYGTPCSLCHDPVPKLNAYGEQFTARGYVLSDEDTTGTTSLGDPLLSLNTSLPIAIRLDAYVRAQGGERVGSDFQTPTIAKLLTGGTLARNVSYYIYLLLAEDGATGPIEDAWLMFRRPLDLPVDVTVGQFQIADPVWKRELRITLENYQILSQRIGAGAANLSYDRGITVGAQLTGNTSLFAEIVNGNGIGEAQSGSFDGDAPKTGVLWLTQQIGPLRLSGLGYYGAQRVVPTGGGPGIRNRTWMAGPAVTYGRGPFELNGQYVYREDSDPWFDGSRRARTNGGFLELLWWPQRHGSRALVTGLYNWVDSEAAPNYETATLNLSWLWARNIRLAAEGTWDFLAQQPRVALGVVTAF